MATGAPECCTLCFLHSRGVPRKVAQWLFGNEMTIGQLMEPRFDPLLRMISGPDYDDMLIIFDEYMQLFPNPPPLHHTNYYQRVDIPIETVKELPVSVLQNGQILELFFNSGQNQDYHACAIRSRLETKSTEIIMPYFVYDDLDDIPLKAMVALNTEMKRLKVKFPKLNRGLAIESHEIPISGDARENFEAVGRLIPRDDHSVGIITVDNLMALYPEKDGIMEVPSVKDMMDAVRAQLTENSFRGLKTVVGIKVPDGSEIGSWIQSVNRNMTEEERACVLTVDLTGCRAPDYAFAVSPLN